MFIRASTTWGSVCASVLLVSAWTAGGAASEGQTASAPSPTSSLQAPLERSRIEAATAYSEAHGGRAVVVMQRGEIAFEQYVQGWNGDRPHPLASGTKSFNGILAMCAIEDGLISSLDEKVCETILEWKDDPRKSQITVRHLLTLSSGLVANDDSLGRQGAGIQGLVEGSDANPDGSAREKRDGPIARRIRERRQNETTPDRFAAAVKLPTEADPGTKFHYGPSHFYAFGEFLDRKLKASNRAERTYFDYLRDRVLVPCGIDVGIDRFAPDSANRPALPSGGHLSAHEWVRFGEMVRRGGLVVGGGERTESRVLSAASLAQCFTPSATNPAYGLTWWIVTGQTGAVARVADRGGIEGEGLRRAPGAEQDEPTKGVEQPTQPPAAAKLEPICDATGKPIAIVMAAGAGGQRLYVIPQADLVVVRFAALGKAGQSYDDATFLRTLLGVAKPAEAANEERGSRLRPTGGARGR